MVHEPDRVPQEAGLFALGSEPASTQTPEKPSKRPAIDLETVPGGPKPDFGAFIASAKSRAVPVGEVLSDPTVQGELARAWMDSNAHERGLPDIVVGIGGVVAYGPKVAK